MADKDFFGTIKTYQEQAASSASEPVVTPAGPETFLDMSDEPARQEAREEVLEEVAEVMEARREAAKSREGAAKWRAEEKAKKDARTLAEINREVDAAPKSDYKHQDLVATSPDTTTITTKKAGLGAAGWALVVGGGLFAAMLFKSRGRRRGM